MDRKNPFLKYLVSDCLAAVASWGLFHLFRKLVIEPKIFGVKVPVEFNTKFIVSLVVIPVFWVILYYAFGHYRDTLRKSRLNEFGQTFVAVLVGVVVIFFTLILDDAIKTYKTYYYSFLFLLGVHFIITYIPRLIFTSVTINKIQKGKIGFNTAIIGANEKALGIYNEIRGQKKSSGNIFVGFFNVTSSGSGKFEGQLPHLGHVCEIEPKIKEYELEEVIVAIESNEHDETGEIINQLECMNVKVKAIPDMYDILTGKVKLTTIFGTPLVQLSEDTMPQWQMIIKQFIDLVVSFLALAITFPFLLVLATIIKLTSKGPVFYTHERIGKFGRPFKIIKFRTMYVDAEKHGPRLSSKEDSRITPVGRFLRKARIDEIPNFINVLKGDMSLVGPRPERQYFIDQIVKLSPHYRQLHKVKPGITSLGQVKFGYAENVDQMLQRLRYDIIYIKNMSLYVDFQIMLYTVSTILKGRGL